MLCRMLHFTGLWFESIQNDIRYFKYNQYNSLWLEYEFYIGWNMKIYRMVAFMRVGLIAVDLQVAVTTVRSEIW